MADIMQLKPTYKSTSRRTITYAATAVPVLSSINVKYRLASDAQANEEEKTLERNYLLDQATELPLLPGACSFQYDGKYLKDTGTGRVVELTSAGQGSEYGSINYSTKIVTINKADNSAATSLSLGLVAGAVTSPKTFVSTITFRTPGVPVVPQSLTFKVRTVDGATISATADFSGDLSSEYIKGTLQHENGTVIINCGKLIPWLAAYASEPWYTPESKTDDGTQVWKPTLVDPTTAIISCVVSTYMPLDPELLGLNPVRLPIDGKVPIFSDGGVILIHNTKQDDVANLTANTVITLSRTGLTTIEIYDSLNNYVPETDNYEYVLANGEVAILSTFTGTGFTPPYAIMHTIEELVLASDVQVTGHIACTSPIAHDYAAGETLVSSVLPCGDLQARVYNEFTQQSWSGVWSNTKGTAILSQYDSVNYPIEIINRTSIQERFAFIFQSTNTVQIVGEKLGVIAAGVSILADIEFPLTDNSYMKIRKEGWGLGWVNGNVFRLNTAAANYPGWVVRTTLQGLPTAATDNYVFRLRGNAS